MTFEAVVDQKRKARQTDKKHQGVRFISSSHKDLQESGGDVHNLCYNF